MNASKGVAMKYKIEIWMYCCLQEVYESDNIEQILKWYKENWCDCYENGGCAFDVYANDVELSFDELYEFGFY